MRKFIVCVLICLVSFSQFGFTAVNPSKEEIEKIIERKATELGIPSVLLKAIARVETNFTQFREDGSTYIGDHGQSIGMMQINNRSSSAYDRERLKYDIEYNVEAGARILLGKWQSAVKNLPWIGNMDPNILENWYFAIWAYNGWADSNNPNTNKKNYTYQEMIQRVCKEAYGVEWTLLDPSLLPKTGKPDKENYVFATPEPFHFGDICFYQVGEEVSINSMADLNLRNAPAGEVIGKVPNGSRYIVTSDPVLQEGYYWYRILGEGTQVEGYVAGNYIKRISDLQSKYSFVDIYPYRQRDSVQNLYTLGIFSSQEEKLFYPENTLTREELCVLLQRILDLPVMNEKVTKVYKDGKDISHWAVDSVLALSESGYIPSNEGYFEPQKPLTREEFSEILYKLLEEYSDENLSIPLNMIPPRDDTEIQEKAKEAVSDLTAKGLLTLEDGYFMPKNLIKRIDTSYPLEYLYYLVEATRAN